MAMLQSKLEIKLDIDPTGAVKGASVVSKNITGVGKAAGGATNAANKFSKTLGTMWRISGGIVLFNIIRKITRALEGMVKAAEDFDTSMHNVLSVTQDDKGFQALNDAVINLALDPHIKDGPALLADGLYFITSAGYSAADAMVILKQAAYGATAGMSTTATASEVLIGTMGAFGYTAKDATYVMNELFGIVAASKYTFNDLSTSMDTVSPTAAALGLTLDEVGAALSTFGFKGVDANTATVQLNAILTAMLKPTTAMTDQIKAFGYENGAAMIKALGFTKTMEMFAGAIGDNDQKMSDLFGDIRGLRGALFLLGDGGEVYNQMLEKMSHSQDDGGATLRALQEQMKSASFQISVLKKDIQILAVLGFGLIAPYLVKALGWINAFVAGSLIGFRHFREKGYGFFHALRAAIKNEIREMFGTEVLHVALHWFDKIIGFFYQVRDVVMQVLPYVQKALGFLSDHFNIIGPAIVGAVIGMKLLSVALMVVNGIIAITDALFSPLIIGMLLVAAVGALFAVAWYNNWYHTREHTAQAIKFIGKWLGKLWDFIQPGIEVAKKFGYYIHDVLFNKIQPGNLSKLPGWLQPIALIFGRITKTVRIFFKAWHDHGFMAALKTIPAQLRALGRSVQHLFDAIGLHHFGQRMKEQFYVLAKMFKDVVKLVDDVVHGRWSKIWGDLKDIAVDYIKLFIIRLLVIPDLIWDIFNLIPWGKVGHLLHRMGAWALGQLWKGLKSVMGWLWDHFKSWLDSRVQAETDAAKQWYDVGRTTISWLWTGYASLADWIGHQFADFIMALVHVGEGFFNIFFNTGNYLVSGLWSGISSAWNWMVQQLTDAWNKLPNVLKKLWEVASPSKLFGRIGHFAMLGLAKGFETGGKHAASQLEKVTGRMGRTTSITVNAGRRTPSAIDRGPGPRAGGSMVFGPRSIIVELKNGSRAEANRSARFLLQEIRRREAAG